jgi:hypothetical protein
MLILLGLVGALQTARRIGYHPGARQCQPALPGSSPGLDTHQVS